MKRGHVSLKVKLAAALLTMRRHVLTDEGGCKLEPIIGHEEAKTMTADQIISRFHFNHHPIPHSQGGPDEPWNLDPMPVAEHQEVTAKKDIPQIAKTKRISKAQEEFRTRLLTPRDERPEKKSKWGSRPFNRRRKP